MTDKGTARLVGALFIVATVSGVIALALQGPLLGEPDLTGTRLDVAPIITGALAELMMAGAIVSIAIAIHPVIKRCSERLALGYVAARTVEGVVVVIDVIALLTLLTAIQDRAGQVGSTLEELIAAHRDWAGVALTFAFTLGAFVLNFALYRQGLVPRWLSVWGLIGAALYMFAGGLALYGQDPMSRPVLALYAPLAVQEMVLAVWLLANGFTTARNRDEIDPRTNPAGRP